MAPKFGSPLYALTQDSVNSFFDELAEDQSSMSTHDQIAEGETSLLARMARSRADSQEARRCLTKLGLDVLFRVVDEQRLS